MKARRNSRNRERLQFMWLRLRSPFRRLSDLRRGERTVTVGEIGTCGNVRFVVSALAER